MRVKKDRSIFFKKVEPQPQPPQTALALKGFGPDNKYPIFNNTPPLMDHQWNGGALDLLDFLVGKNQRCSLLVAPTGEGKAYFIGYAIRYLREFYPEKFPLNKFILVVTKPSIVVQTTRVVCDLYKNKNVLVFSYPQMTSSIGEAFIKWKTKIVNDEPIEWPAWDISRICAIFADECQSLKNFDNDSLQAKVFASVCEFDKFPVIFSSATPYSRPSQTRVIACALRPKIGPGLFLDHRTYPSWIKGICAPADPQEWSPTAMRRVQDVLDPYTMRFGKAHYKHKAIIKKMTMQFGSAEEIKYYNEFFEAYQNALMEQGRNPLAGMAAVLVAKKKFEEAAELIKAKYMPDLARELATSTNSNVIVAFKFRESLEICRTRLLAAGVKENEISIIIGGQNFMERQLNIDNFQADRARYMLLMFDAGGAGLSLHHNKADNNNRPRKVILPTVWNPENFVQVLGRAHRITSESTTYQYVLCLADTVEEEQYDRLRRKCRSLREVTRESAWTGMLDKIDALPRSDEEENDEENYNIDMIGDVE